MPAFWYISSFEIVYFSPSSSNNVSQQIFVNVLQVAMDKNGDSEGDFFHL